MSMEGKLASCVPFRRRDIRLSLSDRQLPRITNRYNVGVFDARPGAEIVERALPVARGASTAKTWTAGTRRQGELIRAGTGGRGVRSGPGERN